ncbi:S-2-haloacid dehalogenase [Amylocarpus encephaloides]|uniref:S-2-haloacid dehalogenase n=1 Tax=Amylocarpus encephaloides TaxID=45428 RepID=A0A9P7YRF7_9HELO|nr:S-2-haloacid dehalogenase [Amylocarpus encephaloides]
MPFNPTLYKALSFDVYGTLVDWETGIYTALLPLLSSLPLQHASLNSRKSALNAYAILEHRVQSENPSLLYPQVLSAVYSRLARDYGVTFKKEEADAFGAGIGSWPAFPDTVEALKTLGKYYKLIVLSNVDKPSFAASNFGPMRGVKFDGIYTAQDIGSYKPDPRNFEYLFSHAEVDFGVKKNEILKVAQSLFHDHRTAKKMEMEPSVWIHRLPAGEEAVMGGVYEDLKGEVNLAAEYGTLGEFAEAVEKAFKREK